MQGYYAKNSRGFVIPVNREFGLPGRNTVSIYRQNQIRTAAALLSLMMVLIPGLACERNSPISPGETPPDDGPISTSTTSTDYYLVVLDGGLNCLGYRVDEGGQVIYAEPRLWLPSPLELGSSFLSGLLEAVVQRNLEVNSLTDVLETAAGSFDGVARLDAGDYSWATYYFCPGYGLLNYTEGGGRGYRRFFLESINVTPGGDPEADHFGLAPGNSWSFTITGSDSEAMYRYEGQETRVVEGPVTVGGQPALVLRSEVTISTYDAGGMSSHGQLPTRKNRMKK